MCIDTVLLVRFLILIIILYSWPNLELNVSKTTPCVGKAAATLPWLLLRNPDIDCSTFDYDYRETTLYDDARPRVNINITWCALIYYHHYNIASEIVPFLERSQRCTYDMHACIIYPGVGIPAPEHYYDPGRNSSAGARCTALAAVYRIVLLYETHLKNYLS